MDPSKRICLKNLPANVTKRDIADLVRNRTGAQPHSIDLGFDASGNIRRYAHFSCEGAKNVLEVLQTGVAMRDQTVYGFPAKPHYSFALAEARRKREREEEVAAQEQSTMLEQVKTRALEKTHGGELSKTKVPKPTAFSLKPKYGLVAAAIARKYRDAQRLRLGKAPYGQASATDAAAAMGVDTETSAAGATTTSGRAKKMRSENYRGKSGGKAAPHDKKGGTGAKRAASAHPGRDGKHKSKGGVLAAPVAPAAPPLPPQPTKEEKKLSGLQARLAALKDKLRKC